MTAVVSRTECLMTGPGECILAGTSYWYAPPNVNQSRAAGHAAGYAADCVACWAR